MVEPPRNVVSFDLEHWYTATLLREAVEEPVDRVEESTRIVLDLLDRHDVSATFFVVGTVARDYPDLIQRVAAAGHEIASHGHTHTPLFDLDRSSFRAELADSADAIERAVGERPVGFRAPNFSVTRRTAWAIEVLAAMGYHYDSSVFPTWTPMYGVSDAPVSPYTASAGAPFVDAADHGTDGSSLIELPPAIFHPRLRLPVAGGFYARLLPRRLLLQGVRNLNRLGMPAMLYFHPWEFNPEVPVDGLPAHRRFVSFHGIGRLGEKLSALLSAAEFTTAGALAEAYGPRPRRIPVESGPIGDLQP